LDPTAFRTVDTTEEFCGWQKVLQYHGYRGGGESYDTTNIVRARVPGNSPFHPALRDVHGPSENERLENNEETDFVVLSEDEESLSGDGGVHLIDLNMNPPQEVPIEGSNITTSDGQRADTVPSPTIERDVSVSSPDSDQAQVLEVRANTSISTESEQSEHESDAPQNEVEQMNMESGSEESSTEILGLVPRVNSQGLENEHGSLHDPDLAYSLGQSGGSPFQNSGSPRRSWLSKDLQNSYAKCEMRSTSRRDDSVLHVPVLHCSTSHIRLLRDPTAETPHLFCAQILKQNLPPVIEDTHHAHLDRLNMLQQIPELGIVIIASQIGRCAVCTLTRKRGGDFGLRVDWVLPNKKQESSGNRPIAPLLGVSVGPIQGRMIRSKSSAIAPADGKITTDRVIDGVPTSFDPNVVILSRCNQASEKRTAAQSETEGDRNHSSSPKAKRKRSSSNSSTSNLDGHLKIEQRPWTRSEPLESWRGAENSRRYRLMLTYSDHTVLSYEISREAEEVGIGNRGEGARKNLRNRHLF